MQKTYYNIGCSGWAYKDWKVIFYPQNLSAREHLSYYATHFKTVEINNTFYRFPTEETVQSWVEKVPENFKFSLKASRLITHVKKLKQTKELFKKFYGFKNILQDKLGCFLFQFSGSFKFTEDNLERLVSCLDPQYKNVVEFRHVSWWNPSVIKILKEANIIFCAVSGFDLPDTLPETKEIAYIRFHGDPPYTSCYSKEVLLRWADKITGAQLKECWIYFNNTSHAYAVQNAKMLESYLTPSF
jgi:uncharacterized protein YecE (DUF72 family)